MKVAIIGANGQLGSDLVNVLSSAHEVFPLSHADIEITDIDSVNQVLTTIHPDVLINTAAYHVVPEAEKFPDRAFSINGTGTLNLAKVCQDKKIRFLHFSTDYVFDGQKQAPYLETDRPNPLNVYAVTKLAGEHFALNYCDTSFVIRVSGIYGKIPSRAKGGNFISTMVKLAAEKPEVRVVNDEVLTPTSTLEIALATASLLNSDAYGLYHMTAEGSTSWYQFAKTIFDTLGLKTPLHAASVSDFPLVVKRPFYSVLENARLKAIGIQLPGWEHSLNEFLKKNYL